MKTQEKELQPMLDIVENENTNSSELTKYKNVENTPFTIVTHGTDIFGVIGSHRITELHENEEECEKDLKEITWDRIAQVIWVVVEKFKFNNEKFNINE